MANIGAVLKQEIQRLSRKESRAQNEALKKASALQRRQIAELRARTDLLARQVATLRKALDAVARPSPDPADAEARPPRVPGAKSIAALRARMGVTVAEFGELVGVSSQSIYNWEHGRARPQGRQLASLLSLKGVGKRGARARLDEIRARPA